jgi:hypothetical protein
MSHYGSDPKSASKGTTKCNREANDIFWPARACRAIASAAAGRAAKRLVWVRVGPWLKKKKLV